MPYQSPRGTQDLLPDEAPRWRYVEETFRRVCRTYGYGEIRTPLFERTELFVRSVGEHTDIVSKEMYSVVPSGQEMKDADALTLRPEGTAPVMRAWLQHGLGGQQPLSKLYYICPVFRHERPQAGRLRQHHQTGVEAVGSQDPAIDAEVIMLGLSFLHRLGIREETLTINSVGCPQCRPAYRERLRDALRPALPHMCGDCRRRFDVNPLRMLDCKVEKWDELPATPALLDHLCAECAEHFQQLQTVLKALDVSFQVNPRLVRGFDYYTKTAFEITHGALGAQNSVLGGGRYDGLIEELGGKPTPGIGFGCGIERVLLICEKLGLPETWEMDEPAPVVVVTLGETARLEGLKLVSELREAGIPAETDYLGRSMKAQMRAANRLHARAALILGEDEVASGVVTLRDMRTHEQEQLPRDQVIARLSKSKDA